MPEDVVGLREGLLPYLEGWKANIVDAENYWVKAARELEMPIKAGISGTTYRFMHQANLMGMKMPEARAAMFGYLIPDHMHSFHEIAVASRAYVPYTDGAYTPCVPWSPAELQALARGTGATEDEVEAILHPSRETMT